MCFAKFNQFSNEEFAAARVARDVERRSLQKDTTKRKTSAVGLTNEGYKHIIRMLDDTEPVGLQRKLFHVISRELVWGGGAGMFEHLKKHTIKVILEGKFNIIRDF